MYEEGLWTGWQEQPFVNERNSKIHLAWAKKVDWKEESNSVIWSDESRFEVYGGDGHDYVWRTPKENMMMTV
ncbi:hypothetical protein RclHR1_01980005 [Rhizophagus clarus]|uniref:Uncharacterized protein LOC105847204 n=1 Tax=Rhizophagus clarus TaxID=94130 RepID=A0A2Z6QQ22_9GLOM|nr:hypothetical protein RclHR1_01980005 [Rhizophagus clarus]GES92989.1 uncharacterized protein LOC105847204 [Rhizophagus clarus]